MTDEDLIRDFESAAIPHDPFHHAEHIRMAFAYLTRYPALQALEKFSAALQRYAAANGKPGLYHETITYAYFFLIRERIARCPEQFSSSERSSPEKVSRNDRPGNGRAGNDWNDFVRRNSDLLVWKNGILTRYYRDATLQSDLARSVFLFPDKF